MTPYELSICLHYYCMGSDWKDGDFSAPICLSTLEHFVNVGLLTYHRSVTGPAFKKTEKLEAFVEYLQKVPLPEQKWIIQEQPGLST